MTIRTAAPRDRADLLEITRLAFGEEELRPLVERLLGHDGAMCLVTAGPGAPEGYVIFTPCRILPDDGSEAADVMLLGPLAVAPDRQRRGLGAALVRAGLARLETAGFDAALVLGDPAYYGRFGFEPATVRPPFPLPEAWAEAWRVRPLEGTPVPPGLLEVPAPWRDAALWSG